MRVSLKTITVQYYGTTQIVLADAVFKPCWHELMGGDIVLAAAYYSARLHERPLVRFSFILES